MPAIQAMTATVCSAFSQRYIASILACRLPGKAPHSHPRTRLSIRSTCAIGVSGRMPWPRLNTSGPLPSSFITLYRYTRLQHIARNRSLESPVNPDCTYCSYFHIGQCHCTCSTRKTNNSCLRDLTAHTFHNSLCRYNTPPNELI